ncbi:hypothetical protein C9975_06010 [Thalassospira xiamenensis]|nr:hypothetical protein C9975_06010 [Thalassospira xiamenensis]
MHYILEYQVSTDYLERRAEFREEHLKLGWAAAARGELVLGGAVGEPIDRAHLLFDVNDPARVRAFAEADPYVKNGLVVDYKIMPWHTVIGDLATNPVR